MTDSTFARLRNRTAVVLTAGLAAAVAWRATRRLSDDAGGILLTTEIEDLYDRIAPLYDLLSSPYEWIGSRRLQRRGIDQLHLQPGDTVVDLGTGTGWNLPRLSDAVGPEGRVIGVDLSREMLSRARRRCATNGCANVELVQADMRSFVLPGDVSAVIAAFAMEMVPDYDGVIRRLAEALPIGGRLAVTGLREPDGWPQWAIGFGALLYRPFGVRPEYRDIRPWTAVADHLLDVSYQDALAGAVYLAAGSAP